jgi:hypothetical protein
VRNKEKRSQRPVVGYFESGKHMKCVETQLI